MQLYFRSLFGHCASILLCHGSLLVELAVFSHKTQDPTVKRSCEPRKHTMFDWRGSGLPSNIPHLPTLTTFSNGYLGSRDDEERSEMRYVMRIAERESSSL